MSFSSVILSKEEGIATITLNRPDKLNAINEQLSTELLDAVEQIAQDSDVRVVVLTGAGRGFCSGGDIEFFKSIIEAKKRGKEAYDFPAWARKICLALRSVSVPLIASINGIAIGGGVTMTLSCDIRLAAEEARMSFPFAPSIGIVPEIGSTYMLSRRVGISKACELIFTGKTVTGREAKEIGLVDDAVPGDKLRETTYELAKTIAEAAPLAIRLSKIGLYQGLEADLYSQVLWEEVNLNRTFGTQDHEEAINAFLERRKPIYKGR